ncbi:30S ribosomal protein S12 methylthiotransferase RimO [bacterium]|nr:30S ribosomal protein S12 methylthiotransferase RimO [bacterium]MCI0601400.1 30S ribosomal protein S12 methylthiotransferase RimO [bacterium]
MKRVGVISLGCPKNLVDTEAMLGQLVDKGYSISANPADSEIVIINTCGFIEPAKKESIETILRAAQLKESDPDKKLIVAGCLVQRYGKELKAQLPEVDHFVSLNDVERIVEACGQQFEERLEAEPAEYIYDGKVRRILTTPSSYAYLKIAEGCDHVCAFCAIPSMRGAYRSRTISSICSEASELARQGVKELVLISQDSTIYGADLGLQDGLALLTQELCKTEGIEWIRVMYSYPNSLRQSFLDVMADQQKVCRYIDMPLQHASGPVLARMKRGGNGDLYRKMIDNIRRTVPDIAIRTTFIAGFPGETEEDFSTLLHFVQDVEFDRVGVFLYSDEEGTSGYNVQPKVPYAAKVRRRKELMTLQAGVSRKKNRKWIGRQMSVIVDGADSRSLLARMYSQAPDVDGVVRVHGDPALPGEFLNVSITGAGEYDLSARLL